MQQNTHTHTVRLCYKATSIHCNLSSKFSNMKIASCAASAPEVRHLGYVHVFLLGAVVLRIIARWITICERSRICACIFAMWCRNESTPKSFPMTDRQRRWIDPNAEAISKTVFYLQNSNCKWKMLFFLLARFGRDYARRWACACLQIPFWHVNTAKPVVANYSLVYCACVIFIKRQVRWLNEENARQTIYICIYIFILYIYTTSYCI